MINVGPSIYKHNKYSNICVSSLSERPIAILMTSLCLCAYLIILLLFLSQKRILHISLLSLSSW